MKTDGSRSAIERAIATAPFEPRFPGEKTISGPVHAQKLDALRRRGLRHDGRDRIALDLADHREGDAGVAARRLEDPAAGLELARVLGGLHHLEGDAVLDRARGVLLLELGEDPHVRVGGHARELDERGVADRRERRAADGLEAAHRAPPAMAGSTISVESVVTAVSIPSPSRTSSLLTYTFTNRFRSPESSSRCERTPGSDLPGRRAPPERSRRGVDLNALRRPPGGGWGAFGRLTLGDGLLGSSHGPRGHGAELLVVDELDLAGILAADRALRVAVHLELDELHRERVVAQLAADERIADPEQQLDRLGRLERPDDPGSTPRTPPSAQLGASSGGRLRYWQR
jgi:hypothetical protein